MNRLSQGFTSGLDGSKTEGKQVSDTEVNRTNATYYKKESHTVPSTRSTMGISKEHLEEFKRIWKEKYNKDLTDAETYEAASTLVGIFDVLYRCEVRDWQRKHRLKTEPAGFPITDGIYNCCLCNIQLAEGDGWYDRYGIKCKLCRKAVNDGIIPGFACEHRESRYIPWQIQDKFGIKHATMRKMIRDGKLKARIILAENGKPYEYIFLKKENPELVDPDRYSPARKSYDKNRNKILNEKIIKEKENQ